MEGCLKEDNLHQDCAEKIGGNTHLHPNPEKAKLQEKLDYLKSNKLNIKLN